MKHSNEKDIPHCKCIFCLFKNNNDQKVNIPYEYIVRFLYLIDHSSQKEEGEKLELSRYGRLFINSLDKTNVKPEMVKVIQKKYEDHIFNFDLSYFELPKTVEYEYLLHKEKVKPYSSVYPFLIENYSKPSYFTYRVKDKILEEWIKDKISSVAIFDIASSFKSGIVPSLKTSVLLFIFSLYIGSDLYRKSLIDKASRKEVLSYFNECVKDPLFFPFSKKKEIKRLRKNINIKDMIEIENFVISMVVMNRRMPEKTLIKWAEHNVGVRQSLAFSVYTPSSVLHILAKDPDETVRFLAAVNKNTPDRELLLLMNDEVEYVRKHAAQNSSISFEIIEAVKEFGEWDSAVQEGLSLRSDMPIEIIESELINGSSVVKFNIVHFSPVLSEVEKIVYKNSLDYDENFINSIAFSYMV